MNIKVGSKVKAAIRMENDMRDEGMGVILCAEKGDILTVKEIGRNGYIHVSLDGRSSEFSCHLSEICEA